MATIKLHGATAEVIGAPEQIVRTILHAQPRFSAGDESGIGHADLDHFVQSTETPGLFQIPVGLASRLGEGLKSAGYTVATTCVSELGGKYPAISRASELLRSKRLSEFARTFLSSLGDRKQGQLIVGNDDEGLRCVNLLCECYAGACVAVVVGHRKAVSELRDRLRAAAPARVRDRIVADRIPRRQTSVGEAVYRTASNDEANDAVIVTTTRGLREVMTFGCRAAVFFDAVRALDRVATETLREYALLPRFCVVRRGVGFSLRERIKLEADFGPAIFHSPNLGRNRRRVLVLTAQLPIEAEDRRRLPRLEAKRRQWGSAVRNRSIAQIAAAFVQGDIGPLWVHGLFLEEQSFPTELTSRRRVWIVVESIEQAEHIATHLCWPIYSWDGGTEKRKVREPNVIVTRVYAQRCYGSPDVVIRAEGSASTWASGIRLCGPNAHLEPPMLVIDCDDGHDAQHRRDARFRRNDYARQSWSDRSQQSNFDPAQDDAKDAECQRAKTASISAHGLRAQRGRGQPAGLPKRTETR